MAHSGPEAATAVSRQTTLGNLREAEESVTRTRESLQRFIGLLEEAGIYKQPPPKETEINASSLPEQPSLASIAYRVNSGGRFNANLLGELLDQLQSELT